MYYAAKEGFGQPLKGNHLTAYDYTADLEAFGVSRRHSFGEAFLLVVVKGDTLVDLTKDYYDTL